MSVLLFVGGVNGESSRLSKAIWDTGHLFLFAMLTWVIMDSQTYNRQGRLSRFTILISLVLVVGGGIEILQLAVGRYFELMDVVFDGCGVVLAWSLYSLSQYKQKKTYVLSHMLLIVMSLVIVFYPVWFVLRDEQSMREAFPVLADFEHVNELRRWELNNAQIALQQTHVRHGISGLAINLTEGRYPGISLKELIGDWRAYRYLKLNILNPQADEQRMELKIYDKQHLKNGHPYADRFNRVIKLRPGWNLISIDLNDIRLAPKRREMDISDMSTISLFLHNVKKPKQMYMDYIYLSP